MNRRTRHQLTLSDLARAAVLLALALSCGAVAAGGRMW